MPWFKVDDSFESHPKVKGIPRTKRGRAIGLWTLAGSWSARMLTDGFVPSYMLDELACTKADASALVAVDLWTTCDGGYRFKGWEEWQPTRARVESDRDAAKERMRVARERKKGSSSPDVRANTSATSPNERERSPEVRSTPRSVTPTRPDPTRPDPLEDGEPASAGSRIVAAAPPAAELAIFDDTLSAQTLVAEWIDHCDQRPPSRVIGQVSKELKTLLDEGIDPQRVRAALAEWNRKGLHPSTLASVVHEITNRKPAAKSQQATDDLFDRAMQRAMDAERNAS